jgi:hypothetical protein
MSAPVTALLALCAALTIADILLGAAAHLDLPPGTWALFGAVGCAAIVVVSKALGKAGLQRPERSDD